MTIQELEEKIKESAKNAGIKDVNWERFFAKLQDVRKHHEETYVHCLRVGYYAHGLAQAEKWSDVKYPLFGGCGHDYGKCSVADFLLSSKNLTPKEFEKIKVHVTEGFLNLNKDFLFSSFIAGLHHKYQEKGYGIDLEESSPEFFDEKHKKKIKATALLVMIADFFDALTTRKNNKGLLKDGSLEEVKRIMTNFFPQNPERIDWLIKNKISVSLD